MADNGVDRHSVCDFLLAYHWNYGSIIHRFRVIWRSEYNTTSADYSLEKESIKLP